jgi:hypothetical protein
MQKQGRQAVDHAVPGQNHQKKLTSKRVSGAAEKIDPEPATLNPGL